MMTGETSNDRPIPLRLLFVCSRNRLRSPTAEEVFASDVIETMSAGVAPDADTPLDAESIRWADVVLFMETVHQTKATRQFASALRGKRIVCLRIPDDYGYMEPALVDLLHKRVPAAVREMRR